MTGTGMPIPRPGLDALHFGDRHATPFATGREAARAQTGELEGKHLFLVEFAQTNDVRAEFAAQAVEKAGDLLTVQKCLSNEAIGNARHRCGSFRSTGDQKDGPTQLKSGR
jgi:hypothetical protein